MARPPNIEALGKLNFITNYFLAGCTPPFFLFCEFAREPAKDLLLLFLLPDLTDIGQAIFDPKAGRRRKPGRHGRKRRRGGGFPDPSDLIGQRVRSVVNPHNALQFGPVNFAFRIWNRYEAVAITAAIIEGLSDTAYQGILGVLDIKPDHCTEFARLVRNDDIPELQGAIGPPIWPVRVRDVVTNTGFTTSQYTCMAMNGPYIVHFTCTIRFDGADGVGQASLALGPIGGPIRATSRIARLNWGESVTLTVSAAFEAGEACEWGLADRNFFMTTLGREVVAFSKVGIPWPL